MENKNALLYSEEKQAAIFVEDLEIINKLQEKLQFAELSRKNVELELNNGVLKIYLKYGLSERDSIDIVTGKISKNQQTT